MWEGSSEFPLSTGAIKFTSLTRFSKVEQNAAKTLVTINFAYDADGAAARQIMERVLKGLSEMHPVGPTNVGQPSIRGGGERLIDASTMTIESEKISRVIRIPMEIPGKGKAVMIRTETKEYAFRCNK